MSGDEMTGSGSGLATGAALLLTILAIAVLPGCREPAATAPEPPGGGREYVLDQDLFTATVAPVFTAKGCDTIECHGGGFRGTFALSPLDDKDLDFEFAQASLQVDGETPAQSPLLLKPLAPAAGGAAHAADPAQHGFLSTDDPGYQAILQWIEAGEFR